MGNSKDNDDDSQDHQDPLDYGPGLLTKTQREYLHGSADIESGSAHERTVRSRIRKRLQNGLRDLATIARELDNRDFEQAAASVRVDMNDFSPAIGTLARMFFLGAGFSTNDDDITEYTNSMEETIGGAVGVPIIESGRFVDQVNVDITIELGEDMSEVNDFDALTRAELLQMSVSGAVNDMSHREFVDQLMRRDHEDPIIPDKEKTDDS